jgi:hypothetical protein
MTNTEKMDEFIKFVEAIKTKTNKNEKKRFINYLLNKNIHLVSALWIAHTTTTEKIEVIKTDLYNDYIERQSLPKKICLSLRVPHHLKHKLYEQCNYIDIVTELKDIQQKYVKQLFIVRTVNKQCDAIIKIELMTRANFDEKAMLWSETENHYFNFGQKVIIDEYPLIEDLNGILNQENDFKQQV